MPTFLHISVILFSNMYMNVYGTPGKNEKRILKHPKWLLNLLNVYQSILGGHGQIHV